ncbi:hypothetical protein NEOLI_002811 [Neolecta irregularis DAH-3]|uniref:Uncharacterized protein n=1 Tax=Neolecta irregularis (strain DAH-3) TaxID=1198029 RepID=A0A1U7LHG5_NEOID|nr:hypothetical protein NEOLI_002811 [Neolecta irregularis DAH-3]|eukprot:OLL22100.1 hypothetical protein NEOLI_002811 [Neolecta irregularis DAH-3]
MPTLSTKRNASLSIQKCTGLEYQPAPAAHGIRTRTMKSKSIEIHPTGRNMIAVKRRLATKTEEAKHKRNHPPAFGTMDNYSINSFLAGLEEMLGKEMQENWEEGKAILKNQPILLAPVVQLSRTR